MTLSFQMRRGLALAGVAAALSLGLPRFLTHTPYARLGVRLDWNTRNPRISSVVGPPGKGLLEKGDVILAMDGKEFSRERLFQRRSDSYRKQLFPRGPVTLTIRRHGVERTLTIPPLKLTAWQRARLYVLPLITVVAAPLVAILLVWRRPDLSVAWVFLLFAVLQALGTVGQLFRFPQSDFRGALAAYDKIYDAIGLWLPAVFLHFMMLFPRPRWAGRRPAASPWFWIVVAGYVTPIVLLVLARVLHTPADRLAIWFEAIAFPLGSLSLIERYARPSGDAVQPALRERVLSVTVAVILCLAAAIDLLPENPQFIALFSLPLLRVFTTALFFSWLATPFLIAYLVANDPAFDPRRLIARSAPYAILSGLLAALYLGIVLVAQRLFAEATGEEALAMNVVAALAVAFAFAPLRGWVQRWLDRFYGRDPLALRRALEQSGRELLSALDRDEVRESVDAAIQRGLRRRMTVEWPEQGMPRLAEDVGEADREAVDALLLQAGIRLENLSLQAQRAAAERRAAELREAAARAELRALHAQVQPHFLFNALNALSYLAETDPPAAQRFTGRLADMLRYSVEAGERPAALLQDEIAFVEDYLAVARERYDTPLRFEYLGPRELLSSAVPPLLLQPLVENSLKHGRPTDGRALQLKLEAGCQDGWLSLRFVDDGAASGDGSHGFGVGLENLAQRVGHFGGPDAAVSAAGLEGGGFAVSMRWRVGAEPRRSVGAAA